MTWGEFVSCTRGYKARMEDEQLLITAQTAHILSALAGKEVTVKQLLGR